MFRNPLTDLIVVLVVVLLVFGPKRLPLLGRSLGQGMREFKDSITGQSKISEEDERPALEQANAVEVPPTAGTAAEAPAAADPTVAPAGTESVQAAHSDQRS